MWRSWACALPVLLAAVLLRQGHAQTAAAGNSTERLDACQDYQLPAEYEPYLNTSFLGERQFVQVETVNFSYFTFGPLQEPSEPGRPLVLIAGQGATSSIWGPDLLNSLAQDRPVVTFDTRGIGESTDTSTDRYTIGLLAESTVAFIQALDLDQPDVLGWSQGGFIALQIAANYSTAINRLVLADTAIGGMAFAATAAGQQLAEALPNSLPFVEAGSPLPPTLIYPDEEAGNAGLCRLLVFSEVMPADEPTQEQTLRQAGALLDFISDSSGNADFVYDSLSDFTTPVLLIAGQQDLILPVAADQAIAELVPGALLVEYPDAGHAAILQHGLTNAALIKTFLDGRPVPPDPSTYSLFTAAQPA